MSIIDQLAAQWMAAKESEKTAVEFRRTAEDAMLEEIKLNNEEGTVNRETSGHDIKITMRNNRKVDGGKLQQLAAENGVAEYLPVLFRWKPDINKAAWDAAADNIKSPLAGAITTKPSRPSFSITLKKD